MDVLVGLCAQEASRDTYVTTCVDDEVIQVTLHGMRPIPFKRRKLLTATGTPLVHVPAPCESLYGHIDEAVRSRSSLCMVICGVDPFSHTDFILGGQARKKGLVSYIVTELFKSLKPQEKWKMYCSVFHILRNDTLVDVRDSNINLPLDNRRSATPIRLKNDRSLSKALNRLKPIFQHLGSVPKRQSLQSRTATVVRLSLDRALPSGRSSIGSSLVTATFDFVISGDGENSDSVRSSVAHATKGSDASLPRDGSKLLCEIFGDTLDDHGGNMCVLVTLGAGNHGDTETDLEFASRLTDPKGELVSFELEKQQSPGELSRRNEESTTGKRLDAEVERDKGVQLEQQAEHRSALRQEEERRRLCEIEALIREENLRKDEQRRVAELKLFEEEAEAREKEFQQDMQKRMEELTKRRIRREHELKNMELEMQTEERLVEKAKATLAQKLLVLEAEKTKSLEALKKVEDDVAKDGDTRQVDSIPTERAKSSTGSERAESQNIGIADALFERLKVEIEKMFAVQAPASVRNNSLKLQERAEETGVGEPLKQKQEADHNDTRLLHRKLQQLEEKQTKIDEMDRKIEAIRQDFTRMQSPSPMPTAPTAFSTPRRPADSHSNYSQNTLNSSPFPCSAVSTMSPFTPCTFRTVTIPFSARTGESFLRDSDDGSPASDVHSIETLASLDTTSIAARLNGSRQSSNSPGSSVRTPVPRPQTKGVRLAQVLPGKPMHRAGAQEGDLILEIQGVKVTSRRHMQRILAGSTKGT